MKTMTLTREDLVANPELWGDRGDLREWEPMVSWAAHMGAFVIGNAAIYFCPWCGSKLPENIEEALAESQKSGVWISVNPEGEIQATVAGEPVDATELMAKLAEATKDQD